MGKTKKIIVVNGGTTNVKFREHLLQQLAYDGRVIELINFLNSHPLSSYEYIDEILTSFKEFYRSETDLEIYSIGKNQRVGIVGAFDPRQARIKTPPAPSPIMNLTNSQLWKSQLPGAEKLFMSLLTQLESVNPSETSYSRRDAFGRAQNCISKIYNTCLELIGVRDHYQSGQVLNASRCSDGEWEIQGNAHLYTSPYKYSSSERFSVEGNILYLSLGGLYEPFGNLGKHPNYILCEGSLTAEQLQTIQNNKGKGAVLASRLTASEVVLTLRRRLPANPPILQVSRTGYHPCVKPDICQPTSVIWDEKINTIKQAIEWLKTALVQRSIFKDKTSLENEIQKKLKQMEQRKRQQNDVTEACKKHFEKELELAEGKRRELMEIMELFFFNIQRIYERSPEQEAKEFYTQYYQLWRQFQVGIPIQTAEELKKYLDERSLIIKSGFADVQANDKGGFTIFYKDGSFEKVDWLVDARGSQVLTKDNYHLIPLVKELVDSGELSLHPNGGVWFDPNTMRAIKANGTINPSIYITGELLTRGKKLTASDVDIINGDSEKVVNDIILTHGLKKTFEEHNQSLTPDKKNKFFAFLKKRGGFIKSESPGSQFLSKTSISPFALDDRYNNPDHSYRTKFFANAPGFWSLPPSRNDELGSEGFNPQNVQGNVPGFRPPPSQLRIDTRVGMVHPQYATNVLVGDSSGVNNSQTASGFQLPLSRASMLASTSRSLSRDMRLFPNALANSWVQSPPVKADANPDIETTTREPSYVTASPGMPISQQIQLQQQAEPVKYNLFKGVNKRLFKGKEGAADKKNNTQERNASQESNEERIPSPNALKKA